jgi:hypothetical protein
LIKEVFEEKDIKDRKIEIAPFSLSKAKVVQFKNPSRLYKLRFASALTEPCIELLWALEREKAKKVNNFTCFACFST